MASGGQSRQDRLVSRRPFQVHGLQVPEGASREDPQAHHGRIQDRAGGGQGTKGIDDFCREEIEINYKIQITNSR